MIMRENTNPGLRKLAPKATGCCPLRGLQSSFVNFARADAGHVPLHHIRPVILTQETSVLPLAFQVIAQKSHAVRVDDLVSRLHRGELERLICVSPFSGPDAVAKTLVDLEHVRE